MSDKVYIVTEDDMNGRAINRVFSSREVAEKHCALRNSQSWDDYQVEEWAVEGQEHLEFHDGDVWHGHYRLADDHYRVTTTKYSGVKLAEAELLDSGSDYVTVWGMSEKAVAQLLYTRAQSLKAERAGMA